MKLTRIIIAILLGNLMPYLTRAQAEATVKLDTNTIMVGDQVYLHLMLTAPKGTKVNWPQLKDTIISEIEILEKSKIDSSLTADKSNIVLHQALKITSFDSGYYAIPPFRFEYSNPGNAMKQFTETEAVLLSVHTVPVDLSKEIRDIKGPMKAPFTFREALPWIIGLLLTAGLGYFIFYYLKKRKKAEPVFRAPVKIKVPPHQIALDALENLRNKKLWQSGQVKEYHTELTDIIRDYIFNKFAIHAPELTSDEILSALNYTATEPSARQKLNETFVVADLVKFAKLRPLPVEHDATLNNAIDFVKATMFLGNQAVEPESTPVIEKGSATEKIPSLTDGKEVKDV
jgi:hypothetical protein